MVDGDDRPEALDDAGQLDRPACPAHGAVNTFCARRATSRHPYGRHLEGAGSPTRSTSRRHRGRRAPPAIRRPPSSSVERLVGPCRRCRRQRLVDRDPLLGQPALVRLALARLPVTATDMPSSGCIDDTGQSLPKLTRAPERASPPIGYWTRCAPAQPRLGQFDHHRVEPGPERLEVGDHAEGANRGRSAGCTSWVWAITGRRSRGPLRGLGVLDGVQGRADAAVTDGVDVDLEAVGVEGGDRLRQLLRRPVGQSARMRGVLVRLEQGGGAGLDDAVGEELHRPHRDQPRRPLSASRSAASARARASSKAARCAGHPPGSARGRR